MLRSPMRPRVLQITSSAALPEPLLFARLAALASLPLAARARFAVQLRDPELPSRALLALGERLREATRALGAALVVNDRLDLALALAADGVHLGRRSVAVAEARSLLPAGAWVSVACHTVEDVARAAAEGADAAVLSPIFASPGKGPPLGIEALRAARAALGGPGRGPLRVALGGVDAGNAAGCLGAGADAVAAIRADRGGGALVARGEAPISCRGTGRRCSRTSSCRTRTSCWRAWSTPSRARAASSGRARCSARSARPCRRRRSRS